MYGFEANMLTYLLPLSFLASHDVTICAMYRTVKRSRERNGYMTSTRRNRVRKGYYERTPQVE